MTPYFHHPAMSQSKLKEIKKSPRHFWLKHLAPNRLPDPETDAMRFGIAVHCALFEPKLFDSQYCVAPEGINKRTKAGREEWDAFVGDNLDRLIITQSQIDDINAIVASVRQKNTAKLLLRNGESEKEIFWTDIETGVECKGKLDYFIEPCERFTNGIIIDLKTTQNADPNEFSKTVLNFGYYNQVAFYCAGIKTIYKTDDYPIFIFIPVEKTPPFECSFFAADENILEIGLKENNKLLNIYKSCINDGHWPGYNDKIQPINLPIWALNKFNFEGEIA